MTWSLRRPIFPASRVSKPRPIGLFCTSLHTLSGKRLVSLSSSVSIHRSENQPGTMISDTGNREIHFWLLLTIHPAMTDSPVIPRCQLYSGPISEEQARRSVKLWVWSEGGENKTCWSKREINIQKCPWTSERQKRFKFLPFFEICMSVVEPKCSFPRNLLKFYFPLFLFLSIPFKCSLG
jgi:hypothetical protein